MAQPGGARYNPNIRRVRPANFVNLPHPPVDMTDRQKLFCQQYLIDWNATQAAIRAGYSKKTAGKKGPDMLKVPRIKEYLDKAKAMIFAEAKVEQSRIIEELASIAFVNPRDFISWKDGVLTILDSDDVPDEIMRAIAQIEESETKNGHKITIKFHSKLESITLLMRHMGMLKEEVSLSGGDKPIKVDHSKVEEARDKIKTLLEKKVEETHIQADGSSVKRSAMAAISTTHAIPIVQE